MVRIWDACAGELLQTLRGHINGVWAVAFTPDGRGLVSGSLDETLKYWDVSCLASGPGGRPNSPGASKRDTLNEKRDVGTREDNNTCTMNFIGHKVRIELADRDMSNSRAQGHVHSVAVSHDGQWVVSGSKDCGVQLWDAKSGIVQLMLKGHKKTSPLPVIPQAIRAPRTDISSGLVWSTDLSPAGSLLATGSNDYRVRICKFRYSPDLH